MSLPKPSQLPLFQPLENRVLMTTVTASVETDPVRGDGDAADDMAVWIHPTDPSLSTIIGTDNGGGIAVYDLDGNELQYRENGDINNVDVRYNFPLDGERIPIIAASNASANTVELYTVDLQTRELVPLRSFKSQTNRAYGLAMFHDRELDKYYVYVNDDTGLINQFEIADDGTGKIKATLVRQNDEINQEIEGMVADDEHNQLYVSIERDGIRQYGAEANDDLTWDWVDIEDDKGGHLTTEIEGLAIYYAANGAGYLIASSQGSNDYTVYDREGDHEYLGRFRIGKGKVDAVTDSDGIDVLSFGLAGSKFDQGMFLAQDVKNGKKRQNFKVVPWERIANKMDLTIDTTQDPRTFARVEDGVLKVFGTNRDDVVRLYNHPNELNDIAVSFNNDLGTWHVDFHEFDSIEISTGDGNDLVVVDERTDGTIFTEMRISAGAGNDSVLGGSGNDTIRGGSGNDRLHGGDGNDLLAGGKGSDSLFGAADNDVLRGNTGADLLSGGKGNNQFSGGKGADSRGSESDFPREDLFDLIL